MQFDPDHLNALACILRRGSFEAAAADLLVTPSAISQRIRALEEKVGAALVNRGIPCTATPMGARLAKHAEDIGLLEAQLARELELDAGPGPVVMRIAVNADSLATWFMTALSAVEGVLFDLVVDDQDYSADWLKRGEVSAAVTAQGRPVTGCDSFELGSLRYVATASPAYMARWFPDGVTAKALALAPCLTFNAKDNLQKSWIAAHFRQVPPPPAHMIPSTHAFIDAARNGFGWGMNPEALIRGPIRNGRLVTLLPDAPLDVALSWQVSRVMATALAPLTEAVRKAAPRWLIT